MIKNYEQFIKEKQVKNIISGFDVSVSELNKQLFDWQKAIVK